MKTKEMINLDLGLKLNYWDGSKKKERVFLAAQIMKQLGYSGRNVSLNYYELEEGTDKITLTKKEQPDFFKQLIELKIVGVRAPTAIMLYESGVWKLIMASKMPIGIKTRNWLAREVLPSIHSKGYYNVNESEKNPLSYLYGFTEKKEQLTHSKDVNHKLSLEGVSYSGYHNQVHKLVNKMTAKEIQTMFNSKESAREIIRQHLPENAATIAIIDELYHKYNKNLEQIEKSNIHVTAKEVFKSLFSLGIEIK